MQKIVERFLGYVKIDTQSNPESMTCPSTEKQWVLAKKLFEELKAIGLSDVTLDENGYIMATLPSNVEHQVPTIGFIAHYDTSPDFSGQGVNPQIIEKYNGEDIVLNEAENIVLSASYFHDIHQYRGQTLITTDGKTLLGADDKAGVAEIVTAMEYMIAHPEIKHGTIRIAFTPDEEIGRGAHKFDVAKFGAQWAYTMDGSHVGELEYENFNAATATIKIKGRGVHPGYAKGKMINAILIAAKLIRMLPKDQIPAKTEGYEGFYHVTDVKGNVEEAEIQLIIRDHDRSKLELKKRIIDAIIHDLRFVYKHASITVDVRDQYYNMKEKIEPVMHIVNIARKAMEELGITPIIKPIRGGTDGSQLSFMGLPCPNIFAGGVNFHGKYEYVPVESMIKATKVIVKIAELTAAK